MLFVYLWWGKVAPPLTNFVTYPQGFTAYTLVTSRPSCFAWKGEEHRIQKTQTLTTLIKLSFGVFSTQLCLYLSFFFHLFLNIFLVTHSHVNPFFPYTIFALCLSSFSFSLFAVFFHYNLFSLSFSKVYPSFFSPALSFSLFFSRFLLFYLYFRRSVYFLECFFQSDLVHQKDNS